MGRWVLPRRPQVRENEAEGPRVEWTPGIQAEKKILGKKDPKRYPKQEGLKGVTPSWESFVKLTPDK